ncbi:class I SAM-dependent methyltransferase [Psychroserpens sp.]
MSNQTIKEVLEHIDIYLIDQILKERYNQDDVILDAGCGSGRNLKWFYDNEYTFYGVDNDSERLKIAKENYSRKKEKLILDKIENLSFESEMFHHIICNAVLHFAKNTTHFELMFTELVRVLKPKGTLFIRMTSDIGIEKLIQPISDGIYNLPDETERFLLTRALVNKMVETHKLSFLEPIKTVNVNDKRCMTTLILLKV